MPSMRKIRFPLLEGGGSMPPPSSPPAVGVVVNDYTIYHKPSPQVIYLDS